MIIEILKEGVESPLKNKKYYKVGQRVIVPNDFGEKKIEQGVAVKVDTTLPDNFIEKAKKENIKKAKEIQEQKTKK